MSEKNRSSAYAFVDSLALKIEEMAAECAGRYSVNEQNMGNFRKLCYLFHWVTADTGGEVERIDISPDAGIGFISIDVPTFELRGDELKRFIDILQFVNKIDIINTGADSVRVDASVPQIWDAVS